MKRKIKEKGCRREEKRSDDSTRYGRMTRFSVGGGGDDREGGPSNRPPKRPREDDPRPAPTPVPTRAPTPTSTATPAPPAAQPSESDSDDDDSSRSDEEQPLPQLLPPVTVNSGQVASTATDDSSIFVILTDPEVLDCAICYESLKIPVFQCENGHIACSSCCTKVKNKCPSCSWPIGYNRCRAIEKVLESVRGSCENAKYGCKEQVNYSKKKDHEDICIYAPSSCPLSGCSFLGSTNQLSLHFRTQHSTTAKSFQFEKPFIITLTRDRESLIFQEEKEGALYILNNKLGNLGNSVTISCIGPKASKQKFSYEITLRVDGFSLKSHMTPTRRSEESPSLPSMFLLIPCGFFNPIAALIILIKHPVHVMPYGLAPVVKPNPLQRRNDPPTGTPR